MRLFGRYLLSGALLAPALGLFPAAATSLQSRPFVFVVPVSLSNLHKNLTLLRVRCWVMPGTNWRLEGGALGEGVSGPVDTHYANGVRAFSGDVTINVPLVDARLDATAAHAYRCQVELYDNAGRVWGDASQIEKRYPIDKASMQVAETGGPLGQ